VRLEAHETKEKATKEQGGDASQKNVIRMTQLPVAWGSENWFLLIQNYAPHRGQEATFRKIMTKPEKVMLDLKCLECTENGIRFLRS